jgi:biotin carboxyl carrier protein
MNIRKQSLVSGVIATLMIPLVHAADPPHCNELFDDAQRLGCYDAVFGKPAIVGAKSNAPAAPVAPAAAATASAATATAAAAAAPQAAAKPAAKPEAYKSSITAVSTAADGRFIATLDNGQRWLQLEKETGVEVKVGDTVTVKPTMFGGTALVTPTRYTVRVKPLE